MPQARKSTRPSSSKSTAFKEPAALKRLNQSLDGAHKALTELRQNAGRNAAKTTRDLHKNLNQSVASARRDTGKLTASLKREFEKAQKAVASHAPGAGSRTRAGAAKTTTAKQATSKSTGSRSTAAKRTAAKPTTAKRPNRKAG